MNYENSAQQIYLCT